MRGSGAAWWRWLAAPWSQPAVISALVLASAAPVMLVGSADVWRAAGQDDIARRAATDASLSRNGIDLVVESAFDRELVAQADRALRDSLDDIDAVAAPDRTVYTLPGLVTIGPPPLRQVGPAAQLVARDGALDSVDIVDESTDTSGGVWISTWFADQRDIGIGDLLAFEAGAIADEQWNDIVQGGGANRIFPIVGLYAPIWSTDGEIDRFWEDAPPQLVPQFIPAFNGPNFTLVLTEETTLLDSALSGVVHWRAPLISIPDEFETTDELARQIRGFSTALVGPGRLGESMSAIATAAGRRPMLTTEYPETASTVRSSARRLDGPLGAARALGGLVGLAAALAVGAFLVERRRSEFKLLASEGDGAVRIGARVAAQLTPPFLLGGAIGTLGALVGPVWYGPAERLRTGALPWWSMGGVLAVALVLSSTVAGTVGVRSLRGTDPRLRTSLGRVGIAVLVSATVGAWVQVGRTVPTDRTTVDLVVVALPVAAILLAVVVLVQFVGVVADAGSKAFARAPTELFLAMRRLARGAAGVRLAAGSLGLGVGLLVFAAALTTTLDRTVDVKLSTEVGGATRVSIVDDLPRDFQPPGPTTLVRTFDTTITPGDVPTRVIAIDPATFADAIEWPEQFGDEVDAVVAALDGTDGAPVPAIAVNGEPSPDVGAFGIGRTYQFEVVDSVDAFPLAGDRRTSLLMSAAVIDRFAAVSNGYASVAEAREAGFPLPVDGFRRALISRAPELELIAALDEAGVRYRETVSMSDLRRDPVIVANRSAFGYLGVIGVVAFAGSLVALGLFLAARRRLRALTGVMIRSMGCSPARSALVSALELGVVLAAALAAAFASVPLVVKRLSPSFDPAPDRPPSVPVMVSWFPLILLTSASMLAVCLIVWWLELRAARRPAGEVLRDAR